MRFPLEALEMADFVALLDPINELADRSDGFVWRLQTEDGDATAVRVFDDDRIVINMSVWETFEALWNFVYASRHPEVMRRRREWFSRMADAYVALWWVPAGRLLTTDDAAARLRLLREHGPERVHLPHALPGAERNPRDRHRPGLTTTETRLNVTVNVHAKGKLSSPDIRPAGPRY